jgi:hypothetical protein
MYEKENEWGKNNVTDILAWLILFGKCDILMPLS